MSTYVFKAPDGKCTATVHMLNSLITVTGKCLSTANNLRYVAAAPPGCNGSYMGTGLPFPSPEVAYQSNANKGTVPIVSGSFSFEIYQPNSYYVECGTKLVKPHVNLYIGNEYFDIPLGNGIALRSLSSLPGMPNRSAHH